MNDTSPIYTEFEDVAPAIGQIDEEDYAVEVARLDDCYTRVCEGTPYSILARPGRGSEAGGLYAETGTARGLQLLGGTVPVPDDVAEIQRRAFDLYCAASDG